MHTPIHRVPTSIHDEKQRNGGTQATSDTDNALLHTRHGKHDTKRHSDLCRQVGHTAEHGACLTAEGEQPAEEASVVCGLLGAAQVQQLAVRSGEVLEEPLLVTRVDLWRHVTAQPIETRKCINKADDTAVRYRESRKQG